MKYPVNVSVVIPAFNAADTIARALDSVLIQTYPASEIIVVDDCSSDDTRAIVERYAAKGVRLLASPQRRGASGARNAGIAAAKGEAVAFLDSDDEWLNPKLEMQVALLTSSPKIAFVACGSALVLVYTGFALAWRRLARPVLARIRNRFTRKATEEISLPQSAPEAA